MICAASSEGSQPRIIVCISSAVGTCIPLTSVCCAQSRFSHPQNVIAPHLGSISDPACCSECFAEGVVFREGLGNSPGAVQ